MIQRLLGKCDLTTGTIDGSPVSRRRLSEMQDAFGDARACAAILRGDDPVLYTVSTFDVYEGPGHLRCGLGVLFPGRVGEEYFLTRGHLHERREAAEIYVGLRGMGLMLMQREDGTGSTTAELTSDSFVYVPGYTAHRTVNVGDEPLIYLGIYPADAGHDYEPIRAGNFSSVVVCRDGRPAVLPRSEFLHQLQSLRQP
jgi:glucose-6-phosphate isomerase